MSLECEEWDRWKKKWGLLENSRFVEEKTKRQLCATFYCYHNAGDPFR